MMGYKYISDKTFNNIREVASQTGISSISSISISQGERPAPVETDAELRRKKLKLPPYNGDRDGWYLWRRLV